MTREPLDRLLANVTDEELDSLRDAILREEGRRRSQFRMTIKAPYPPLSEDDSEGNITRWARLLTWMAKDSNIPPAQGKRGVSIRLSFIDERPDPQLTGRMLQEALVAAGLLLGRTPEWMDATSTEVKSGDIDAVSIEMWDKSSGEPLPWS